MDCCENKNIIKKKENVCLYKLWSNTRIFLDRI